MMLGNYAVDFHNDKATALSLSKSHVLEKNIIMFLVVPSDGL